MDEMSKHGRIGAAAMKAGMDRKTARKYITANALPSALVKARDWRTRADPFVDDWPEAERWLRDAPGLEAKTIFEQLAAKYPGRYDDGQLRTLQRRVKLWRAEQGPDKDVVLAQHHRPGEAAQTDFTSTTELGVTIGGAAFAHLLCVFVLPYSNWRWATITRSESIAAIRCGVQRALFQLGRVPEWHQTDNSTAATHNFARGKNAKDGEPTGRQFNDDYLAIMRHFEMKPRTTEVGAKEQNGDVEASNGAIKRALEQALLVRGHRDFTDAGAWQAFIDGVVRKQNRTRGDRFTKELAAMRQLNVARLPEYAESEVLVSAWSTVRIKHCSYSVPSRLVGSWVRARLFEDRVEVWFAGKLQLGCDRLQGRNRHRIDYRHVVWSLVRKPGGFARYVYREELFPSLTFRRAYDALVTAHKANKADREYVRILHLAASTVEADVDAALSLLLADGAVVSADAVKAVVGPATTIDVPQLEQSTVDLAAYDALLAEVGS